MLAWLAGPGRCGLVPMTAPVAGAVRWRRAAVLTELGAGEPAVVLGDDAAALTQAQEAQRSAARLELTRLDAELVALSGRNDTALAQTLLASQRAAATRRREALEALLGGAC